MQSEAARRAWRVAWSVRALAWFAVSGAVCLGGCAALVEGARAPVTPNISRVSLFERPWLWTDEQGQSVSLARFRGEPLVVSAFYTSCRVTCPRTIARLLRLHAELSAKGAPPEFVLVTLDPTQDTPAHLRSFKQEEHLPPSWHLLSGSISATQAFSDALDIHVLDMGAHRAHDARIVIFDRAGKPTRFFAGWSLDDELPLL